MKNLYLFILIVQSSLTLGAAYEPFILWDKAELKLCFKLNRETLGETELKSFRNAKDEYDLSPKEMKASDKNRVLKFLAETFTPNSTGISFTQTETCEDFDVLVIKNRPPVTFGRGKKKYGRASMGEAGLITYRGRGFFNKKPGFYSKSGFKAYVALKEVDRTTTLHEFGHIAGLRHEHARDEAYEDAGCFMENPPSAFRTSSLRENLDSTTEVFGPYDPESFMNYCYINRERDKINAYQLPPLSSQDKAALKSLFSR